MGTVSDRDGIVLAYTDNNGERQYNGNKETRKAVSHIIGDSAGVVATGVDTFHSSYLLGFKRSFFERVLNTLRNHPQKGDDIELTVSSSLSRYISEQFPGEKRGAVVVINYKTAEILGMVSFPEFDPEHVGDVMGDDEAGALINRATQGLYPPGSTFKIITLASVLENLPDMSDFAFDCTGYLPVGNYSVTDNEAHGIQTLSSAFVNSCNTTFAALSQELGYEILGKTAEQLGFNKNFMFSDLIVYNSSYPIDNLSQEDLAWSSIGQGRVLTTPLHMALIACTVANGGVFKEPHLIKKIITGDGKERALPAKAGDSSMILLSTAKQIEKEMINVVKQGTGNRAALNNGYVFAGKTGSAEISNDKNIEPHAWFVGYLVNDRTPYAISVLIENGGSGGRSAAPLARKIMLKAINLGL